jgi:membrane-associated protein
MVEAFLQHLHEWIELYPNYAPLFVFLCIALSSCTFVVSLDLLIFTGAMVGVYFNSFTPYLLACFLGTFFCAQVDYWLGRILGNRILKIKKISGMLSGEKLDKIQSFFQKYGPMTFIVGRFIPFGFRLAMFLSAGLFKYRYPLFVIADLVAAFIWTSCAFTLFYYFGQNASIIKEKMVYIIAILSILGVIFFTIRLIRKRYAKSSNPDLANTGTISTSIYKDEP